MQKILRIRWKNGSLSMRLSARQTIMPIVSRPKLPKTIRGKSTEDLARVRVFISTRKQS